MSDPAVDLARYKLKENVRDQHRKILRWQLIGVVIWMAAVNLVIIWAILNSRFDENAIKAIGRFAFVVGFVVSPNIVMSLPPLLYLNSNVYRAKMPGRIKKGVEGMYRGEEDEDKSDWDRSLETEIGGLPY